MSKTRYEIMIMNVPLDEIPYFRLGFIFMFLICLIGFVLSIGYLAWELMRLVLVKEIGRAHV